MSQLVNWKENFYTISSFFFAFFFSTCFLNGFSLSLSLFLSLFVCLFVNKIPKEIYKINLHFFSLLILFVDFFLHGFFLHIYIYTMSLCVFCASLVLWIVRAAAAALPRLSKCRKQNLLSSPTFLLLFPALLSSPDY